MTKIQKQLLLLILAVYLIFALSSALTLLPGCDEAWFTVPGYNLVENGYFGTTVLDETATFRKVDLRGINHATYWIMPVYPVLQGVIGKVAGYGMIQTRAVSIFFGLIILLAWAILIGKLSDNTTARLMAIALMAVDYHFIYAAGFGRMDMMTVALGVSSLAVFVWLREKNIDRAVFFSFALAAAAFFTHPLGIIWTVSLTVLIVLLDLRNFRLKHVFLAAMPFSVLGLCWFIYILQNPELFSSQFGGNASDRWGFLISPFTELWRDLSIRYLANFGIGEGLGGFGRIKVVILAAYLFSIAGVLSVKTLRKSALLRFLVILSAQQFIMLLILDGMKQKYYLIHIVPTFIVIAAFWINWLISKGHFVKWVGVALFLTLLIAGVGVDLSRFSRNEYNGNYLAVSNFLNQSSKPEDIIFASAEFWFSLDRKENLVDDYRLGYLSGRTANFIVIDEARYKEWINTLAESEPQTYSYIRNLLQNDFEPIFGDKAYKVYKRRSR